MPLSPDQPVIELGIGDSVNLGTLLANLHLMGIVTDINNPNLFAATLEMYGDTGVLAVPVLRGPPGPAGTPQFALRFQNDNTSDPAHLPTDLTNTEADVGKYWIFKREDVNGNVVGTTMFVWYGTEYRQLPVGSQGPPGPYPIITPRANLIDENLQSYVEVTGPASNPQWILNLAVPHGPPGPAASLGEAPDFDLSAPPAIGQVVGFAGKYDQVGRPVFQMMNVGDILPMPYTIPEAAFQSYSGISAARQVVCTWDCPKQDWPWKPFVWGQIQATGFEFVQLGKNPFLIGAEIRLNDPNTGPLVGRGFGTSTGAITIIPHTSAPNSPNTAMSPDNALALVQAGTPAKLYVSLFNDGMAASYDFDPENAQVAMLALPIGTEKALPTAYFGTFGGRGQMSATWESVPSGS